VTGALPETFRDRRRHQPRTHSAHCAAEIVTAKKALEGTSLSKSYRRSIAFEGLAGTTHIGVQLKPLPARGGERRRTASDAIASRERVVLTIVADGTAVALITRRFESASLVVDLTLEHLIVLVPSHIVADGASTLCCSASAGATTVPTLTPDRRHVRTIAADSFASLAARDPSLVRREFVSGALGMSCPSTFTRNFTLLRCVH
jgi:hypothetical protein